MSNYVSIVTNNGDDAMDETLDAVKVSVVSTVATTGGTPTAVAAITSTTVATVLATLACKSVLLQADPDNTVDLFIGDATNQPIQLTPGMSLVLPVSNTNLIYHKSASATGVLNVISVN